MKLESRLIGLCSVYKLSDNSLHAVIRPRVIFPQLLFALCDTGPHVLTRLRMFREMNVSDITLLMANVERISVASSRVINSILFARQNRIEQSRVRRYDDFEDGTDKTVSVAASERGRRKHRSSR